MSTTVEYKPLELFGSRKGYKLPQGHKVGHVVRNGQEHAVRVVTQDSGASYTVYLLPREGASLLARQTHVVAGILRKFGAGRNQGYTLQPVRSLGSAELHHGYSEHGTLAHAVERLVNTVLESASYVAEKETLAKAVEKVLPYKHRDIIAAHGHLFPAAESNTVAVAVESPYIEGVYVGYYSPEEADAAAREVEEIIHAVHPQGTVRTSVYGKIDPSRVIYALKEHGVNASPSADGTEAQIYFNNHSSALLIGKNGDLAEVTWDRTGGVSREREVAQVETTEEAIRAALLWDLQHGLQERAQALLDYLQEQVPPSVAHWAVENGKKAARDLVRQAITIDFLHGREVGV